MKLRPRPSHEGVSAAAVGSSRKTKARVQKPRSKKARSTQITHLKKVAVASMVADTEENSNTKSSKRTSSTASHEKIELSALTKQEMIAIRILAVDFPSGYIGIQLPEIPSATIPVLNLSSPTAKRIRKQFKSKDFSSLERLLKPEGNESEKDPGLQSSNPSNKRVSFADPVVSSPSETPRKPPSKPHTRPTRPSAKSTRLEEDPKKQSVPKLNDPTSTRRRGCGTAYRECIICATSKPLGHNGANFPKFEQCSHEPLTCTDCVAKHITITLESRKPLLPENVDSMRKIAAAVWSLCSCPQCGTSLTEEALFPALSRADMGRISALVAVKTREESPRWFSCISPTCNSGQLHPVIIKNGLEVQKVTCVACGLESCFYHRQPWHEGYTCAQYDDNHPLARSEKSSVIKIKQMTKKCPTKGCGWRISKAGGCGTIRCIKCNQYWGWGSVRYEIKRR